MTRRHRHNLLLATISLLFLFSSVWGLLLQSRHEQLVDIFYRNTHWNISQVMLESQRFLYGLRLYRAGGLEMEALSLDYDLLWNRLDVFLISSETADARTRHGLGAVLARLFDEIKALEPQMQAGALQEGEALDRSEARIAELTLQVEQIGDQILSGQEREASLNQLRQSLFWIQIWQLILLVMGGVLVFALIRTNLQNRRLSLLDPMTRLGNRRALQGQLRQSLQRNHAQALVVLDLKRFKQVNDLLGYQVGDRLLQAVAARLRQAYPGRAYRLGGDEFAVVLAGEQPGLEAEMETMVSLLQFEFVTRESSFDLACRFGVARAIEGEDGDQLLEQAILALNQAKRDNATLIWYQPAMKASLHMGQRQLHQLREWLAGAAPSPLETISEPLEDERGQQVLSIGLRWRVGQQVCDMDWMQERGILGPVVARLLTDAEPRLPLLLVLHQQSQLTHVLAYLPPLGERTLILALPTLTEDVLLLEKLSQRGCVLALRELGSRVPVLLRAGWPVRYWLPEPSDHDALLQPLAQQLGLLRLGRPAEAQEGEIRRQGEPR
ncbi:diguanylate cyclase [Aeromonas media]|uniref:GGDEF domain-containing protein n=1 Tax=Aeromonas media TaxID=651 RepID=UPI00143DB2F0|nr:GGDEF domain-containing protein [Aeromonas media]MBS4701761.1 GGDEF domain-containing protein [Aeromonas media]QIY86397.1 GGDEF domain-containing protein [Aeromonas hydrophila]